MSRPQGYLGYFFTSSSVLVASGKNSYLISSLEQKREQTSSVLYHLETDTSFTAAVAVKVFFPLSKLGCNTNEGIKADWFCLGRFLLLTG